LQEDMQTVFEIMAKVQRTTKPQLSYEIPHTSNAIFLKSTIMYRFHSTGTFSNLSHLLVKKLALDERKARRCCASWCFGFHAARRAFFPEVR
jgi:hypothetical protein